MRSRRHLPTVQVSGDLSSHLVGTALETNVRLVTGGPSGSVTCRRVEVRSAVWCDHLRASVCSILRREDGVIAVRAARDSCDSESFSAL